MMKTLLASLTLIGLLTLQPSVADAGSTSGPQVGRAIVPAYSSVSYVFQFQGEERWNVWVSGDGDTDLDCYVYDGNGNEVDRDDDSTDDCILTGVPRWTGYFTVKIVNRGRVYNEETIRTN